MHLEFDSNGQICLPVVVLIYLPTRIWKTASFLHLCQFTLSNFWIFNLQLKIDILWAAFHMFKDHLYYFLYELCSVSLLIFQLCCWSFLYWFVGALCWLGCKLWDMNCNIFFSCLSFIFWFSLMYVFSSLHRSFPSISFSIVIKFFFLLTALKFEFRKPSPLQGYK